MSVLNSSLQHFCNEISKKNGSVSTLPIRYMTENRSVFDLIACIWLDDPMHTTCTCAMHSADQTESGEPE